MQYIDKGCYTPTKQDETHMIETTNMCKAPWIELRYFCFFSCAAALVSYLYVVYYAGTTYQDDTWDWIVAYECDTSQNIKVEYVSFSVTTYC